MTQRAPPWIRSVTPRRNPRRRPVSDDPEFDSTAEYIVRVVFIVDLELERLPVVLTEVPGPAPTNAGHHRIAGISDAGGAAEQSASPSSLLGVTEAGQVSPRESPV